MNAQFKTGEEVIILGYQAKIDDKMYQEKTRKEWFYLFSYQDEPFVRAWIAESVLIEENCISPESVSYVEAMLAEQEEWNRVWFQNGSE